MTGSDRWGHIFRESIYRKPIMALGLGGHEYVASTHGPQVWILKCDCGYTWEIAAADFPGRRALRSCGRSECPHTSRERTLKIKERGSSYSVYLAQSISNQVAAYAKVENISFSKALRELVHEGLVAKLINE